MSQNLIDLYNEELNNNPSLADRFDTPESFVAEYSGGDTATKEKIQKVWFPAADPSSFKEDPKKKSTVPTSNSSSPFGNSNSVSGSGSSFDPLKQELNKLTPAAPTIPAAINPELNKQGPLFNTGVVEEKAAADFAGVLPFQKGFSVSETFHPKDKNAFLQQDQWLTLNNQPYNATKPDEVDLGTILMSGEQVNIPTPVTYILDGKEYETNILDKDTYKQYLQSQGFNPEEADAEINRVKDVAVNYRTKMTQMQQINYLQQQEGWGAKDVTARYKKAMDDRGFNLLDEEEKRIYTLDYPQYIALKEKIGQGTHTKQDLEEYNRLSIELREMYGPGIDRYYNPETGKLEKGSSVSEKTKSFSDKLQNDFIEYLNTDKDKLEKARNELFIKQDLLVQKLGDVMGEHQEIPADPSKGLDPGIAAKGWGEQIGDVLEGFAIRPHRAEDDTIKTLRDEIWTTALRLKGMNRALMLNVDPTQHEDTQSALQEVRRGLGADMTTETAPVADIARAFVAEAKDRGLSITEGQEQRVEETMGQIVTGSVVQMIPAMVQIALAKNVITEFGTATKMSALLENSLTARLGEGMGKFTYSLIEGAATYELAQQGAATGLAETAVQNTVGDLIENSLKGKLTPILGRVAEYVGRIAVGTAGETVEEFAGAYVQALSDSGFDWEASSDQAFGKNMDEFWKQFAVIAASSAMMSAGFNLGVLTKGLTGLLKKAKTRPDADKHRDMINYLDEVIRTRYNGNQPPAGTPPIGGNITSVSEQPTLQTTWPQPPIPIENMSTADLETWHEDVKKHEEGMLERVFGEEDAKKYRDAENVTKRMMASNEEKSAAYKIMSELEDKLTPEQDAELFGVGVSPNVVMYESSQIRKLTGEVSDIQQAEDIDELASIAVSTLLKKAESMGVDDPEVKLLAKKVGEQIKTLGSDPKIFIEKVTKKVGSKYSDANDAEFMMRNTMRKLVDIAVASASESGATLPSNQVNNGAVEPSAVTAEDGWTFVRMPDGSYTDGDQTYSSWKELEKVNNSEELGLKQSTLEREQQQRSEESVKEIENEILTRKFKDKLEVWNYVNDESLKRMGYDRPMDMSEEDLVIHTYLVKKGVEEFEANQLSTVAQANDLITAEVSKQNTTSASEQPPSNTVEQGLPLFKTDGEAAVSPEDRKKIDALVTKLSKAFPGVRLQIFDTYDTVVDEETGETVSDIFDDGTGQSLETSGGTVYGFIYNGKVVLNANVLTSEVPIHEFGHLWINLMENQYPAFFSQILDTIKEYGQVFIDEVNNNPGYAQLSELMRLKEALAVAIGKYGAVKYDRTLMDKIKDFFIKIGETLGIIGLPPNKPFRDLMNQAYSELTGGKTIGKIEDIYPGLKATTAPAEAMIQYTGQYGRSVSEIQQDYNNKRTGNPNQSEADTILELLNEGNSIVSLNAALGFDKVGAVLRYHVMDEAEKVMAENANKLLDRRNEIINYIDINSTGNLEQDIASLLNRGYTNFEIFNGLIEQGYDPTAMMDMYGMEYHETIKKLIEDKKLAPEMLAEIGVQGFRVSKNMGQLVEVLDNMDLGAATMVIDHAATMIDVGGQDAAFYIMTEALKKIMKGGTISATEVELLEKTKGMASHLGRMLAMMRGISKNENGSLEQAILEGAKKEGVTLSPGMKQELTLAVREQVNAKIAFEEARAVLQSKVNDGEAADDYLERMYSAESRHLAATAALNALVHRHFPPLINERMMATEAKAALSFRSTVLGGLDNWFHWLVSRSWPAMKVQQLSDILFNKTVGLDRTLRSRIPDETEAFSTLIGEALFDAGKETVTFTVKDTRNFPVGAIISTPNGTHVRVVSKSRTKITAKYIPGSGGFVSDEFADGTEVHKVIRSNDPKFQALHAWALKQARRQSWIQLQSALAHGYVRNDNLTRQWSEAFAGVDPFKEGVHTISVLFGLMKKRTGKSVSEMTDEEFADATGALLREDANGELKLIHSKGHVITGKALSHIFSWLEVPGEIAIRSIGALSGDRYVFNRVLYTNLLQDAMAEGIVDPEAIKNYIIQKATRIQYDPTNQTTRLAARQIYANNNLVADKIIGLRMHAIKKAREQRSNLWKMKGDPTKNIADKAVSNIRRGMWNVTAHTTFILSPFTKIPTNSIIQAFRKTILGPSIAIQVGDIAMYTIRQREFKEKYPFGKVLSYSEERQMKEDMEDLRRRRRIINEGFSDIAMATALTMFVYPLLFMSGAATPPSGDRDKDKLRLNANRRSGEINFSHLHRVLNGKATKHSPWRDGDIRISYPNLGLFGYGAAYFASDDEMVSQLSALENNRLNNFATESSPRQLFMHAFTGAAESVSLFTQWSNLMKVFQQKEPTSSNYVTDAVEELLTSAGKLVLGPLAPNLFSGLGRGTGDVMQTANNYFPETEVQEGNILYNSRMATRIWTALSGRIIIPELRSKFYDAQIGIDGKKLNVRGTLAEPGTLGAFLQSSFDPTSMGVYEDTERASLANSLLTMVDIEAKDFQQARPMLRTLFGPERKIYTISSDVDKNNPDHFEILWPVELYDQYVISLRSSIYPTLVEQNKTWVTQIASYSKWLQEQELVPTAEKNTEEYKAKFERQNAEYDAIFKSNFEELNSQIMQAEESALEKFTYPLKQHYKKLYDLGKLDAPDMKKMEKWDPELFKKKSN